MNNKKNTVLQYKLKNNKKSIEHFFESEEFKRN